MSPPTLRPRKDTAGSTSEDEQPAATGPMIPVARSPPPVELPADRLALRVQRARAAAQASSSSSSPGGEVSRQPAAELERPVPLATRTNPAPLAEAAPSTHLQAAPPVPAPAPSAPGPATPVYAPPAPVLLQPTPSQPSQPPQPPQPAPLPPPASLMATNAGAGTSVTRVAVAAPPAVRAFLARTNPSAPTVRWMDYSASPASLSSNPTTSEEDSASSGEAVTLQRLQREIQELRESLVSGTPRDSLDPHNQPAAHSSYGHRREAAADKAPLHPPHEVHASLTQQAAQGPRWEAAVDKAPPYLRYEPRASATQHASQNCEWEVAVDKAPLHPPHEVRASLAQQAAQSTRWEVAADKAPPYRQYEPRASALQHAEQDYEWEAAVDMAPPRPSREVHASAPNSAHPYRGYTAADNAPFYPPYDVRTTPAQHPAGPSGWEAAVDAAPSHLTQEAHASAHTSAHTYRPDAPPGRAPPLQSHHGHAEREALVDKTPPLQTHDARAPAARPATHDYRWETIEEAPSRQSRVVRDSAEHVASRAYAYNTAEDGAPLHRLPAAYSAARPIAPTHGDWSPPSQYTLPRGQLALLGATAPPRNPQTAGPNGWTHTGTHRYPAHTGEEASNTRQPPAHASQEWSGRDAAYMSTFLARQSMARDLPDFAGDSSEWPGWSAQFRQSTDACGLLPAENLARLQRCLKGRAREAVDSLLLDPEQVPEIYAVLYNRFGNPHALATLLMERVKKMQAIGPEAPIEALSEFAGGVHNLVKALGNIRGEYVNHPSLLSEVASKMPMALRIPWLAHCAKLSDAITVADLSAFLKPLADAIPRSGIVDPRAKGRAQGRRELVHLTESYEDDAPPRMANACWDCGSMKHHLTSCPAFLAREPAGRWEIAKTNRLCKKCLEPHPFRTCKAKVQCAAHNCRGAHHTLVHLPDDKRETVGSVSAAVDGCGRVLLKVLPLWVEGPARKEKIYALLDEGSTVTLLDAGIANRIGAKGPVQALRLHGAGGMCASDMKSRRVTVAVRAATGGARFELAAGTIEALNLPEQYLADNRAIQPQLLIGMDNAHLIVSREVREKREQPLKSRTKLGWVCHGRSRKGPLAVATTLAMSHRPAESDNRLSDLIKWNFAVESLGVTSVERTNAATQRAQELMRATTRHLDSGKWETGLLWKSDNVTLPDNRSCALKRLTSLERKLGRDPALAEAYNAKMRLLLENDYAREVSADELAAMPTTRRWYLPHFAVVHPNKPAKIRVVFDAASRCRGVSLNDQLLTGPDLLSSLLGNIIRFREGAVAVAADIKDMFLRIGMRKEDQPSQLFLWRTDSQQPTATYVMKTVMFGATCSPSSAQFVRNAVANECQNTHPAAAAAIQENFYMDDFLVAVDTPEEAACLARDVTTVLARGGFHLTNWISNDPDAVGDFPADRRAITTVKISHDKDATERILGLVWDPVSDHFTFPYPEDDRAPIAVPTKRQLLSEVMKVFDPAGFLSCLTVRSRILLQDVWRSDVGWDEPITQEHAGRWQTWRRMLRDSGASIPRQAVRHAHSATTLHMFADASELACCTVAYVTEEDDDGMRATFVASKSKVAPLKPLTIPRLELQAALMAARLATTIRQESRLRIMRTVYWTDSSTVLCWLRTDPRKYSAFVANRLGEIDELTDIPAWRWVPTKLNPADAGTRDQDPPDLSIDGFWFKGPDFLTKPESGWPQERDHLTQTDDKVSQELKPVYVGLTVDSSSSLPDVQRFSSWRRLIRCTAWVLRFVRRCRQGRRKTAAGPLLPHELREAEEKWTRRAQRDAFGPTPTKAEAVRTLSPFLCQRELLRCGSRLRNLEGAPSTSTVPIVLDGAHPYTRLLIRHYHEKDDHPSAERTMAEISGSFHILKLRTTLRKLVHICLLCRVRKARPVPPLMAALPACRLNHHARPFTNAGLDYFGPVEVTVQRHREKRYVALFTCLTTRAVHLELVPALSADAAIMAIQRMTARRGAPAVLYSDNATNFHGAERELQSALVDLGQDPRTRDYMTNAGTEWRFIPPMSPHMGGAWERLVRTVKRALGAILREKAPREDTLRTALAEAEYSVNCRPLTHVSVDPRDEEPLTPNHFLLGSAGKRPHLAHYDADEEEICLKKQWRISQQLADTFWRRWIREYLPTIAVRQKWNEPTPPVAVDDLVLLVDPDRPRNTWTRGRVVQVVTAEDGQVRTVRVRTATGIYTRPAVKIAVLRLATPTDAKTPAQRNYGRQGRRRPHPPRPDPLSAKAARGENVPDAWA